MPSMLLRYVNGKQETQKLEGIFRSFAWDREGKGLILVGDKGRILRTGGERSTSLTSGTSQNLRGISVNSKDGKILIVGNGALVLQLDEDDHIAKVDVPTSQNLRTVSWNTSGTSALIAGNAGTLLHYSNSGIKVIDGLRANLRHVSWQPRTSLALVTSNCFAEEFIPSPNLISFDAEKGKLSSLNEGRVDLIGADWRPDGTAALVAGYDVIWHNGMIALLEGGIISPFEFESKRVYPVAVAWNPTKQEAAIVTATPEPGMGEGILFLLDENLLRPISRNAEFFFSAVAWNKDGTELCALGSSATRTFNC